MSVSSLARERYINLTTRKADGTTASTPVWVVSDDGRRLLVWTGANTWKARRIRRDPRVLVAASDARGREKGPRLEGRARLVDEGELVTTLLRRKYAVQKRALDGFTRVVRALTRKPPAPSVYIEIVDDPQQQV